MVSLHKLVQSLLDLTVVSGTCSISKKRIHNLTAEGEGSPQSLSLQPTVVGELFFLPTRFCSGEGNLLSMEGGGEETRTQHTKKKSYFYTYLELKPTSRQGAMNKATSHT